MEQWRGLGVVLHSCDGFSLDTSTAIGYFLAVNVLNVAAYEPRRIAERTRQAKRAQKAAGRRTGRHPRFGYRFDESRLHPCTSRPYMEIEDPTEQAIRQDILTWSQKGDSLSAIARRLNEQSIFSPRRTRRQWDASFVKKVIAGAM